MTRDMRRPLRRAEPAWQGTGLVWQGGLAAAAWEGTGGGVGEQSQCEGEEREQGAKLGTDEAAAAGAGGTSFVPPGLSADMGERTGEP